jgi:hypothetical protein
MKSLDPRLVASGSSMAATATNKHVRIRIFLEIEVGKVELLLFDDEKVEVDLALLPVVLIIVLIGGQLIRHGSVAMRDAAMS